VSEATQTPKAPKFSAVPRHVAIVMDGNGRWANNRGLNRTEGHRAGESALFDVVIGAIQAGVEFVTVYAFSTENWKRSPEEVRFLMGFNREVLRRRRAQLAELNVRLRWVGTPKRLWSSVVRELADAEAATAKNTGLTLTMAVNYGGRQEIVTAVQRVASRVAAGELDPGRITEKTVQRELYAPDLPDVDLFLRSSGEMRTSNFLPWQSTYAEMVFLPELWPDFNRETLWRAISEYGSRQRRFGAATDTPLN
jgi:undecaprenyl diphosphate synthase